MWNVGKYGEKNIWLSGYVFTTPSAAMGGGEGGMLANKSVVESENRGGSPLALSGDRCEGTNFSLSFFQLIGRERRGGGDQKTPTGKKWGGGLAVAQFNNASLDLSLAQQNGDRRHIQ